VKGKKKDWGTNKGNWFKVNRAITARLGGAEPYRVKNFSAEKRSMDELVLRGSKNKKKTTSRQSKDRTRDKTETLGGVLVSRARMDCRLGHPHCGSK